jgi:hypothetical protein
MFEHVVAAASVTNDEKPYGVRIDSGGHSLRADEPGMHEHVFVLGAEMLQNYPGYPDHWDEQDHNEVPFQFHYSGPGLMFDMPEPMVELFVRDIRDGIAGTAVKRPSRSAPSTSRGSRPAWSG